MTNKFSPKVSEILDCSRQEAQKLACGAITPELILLGLLGDDNNALSPLFLEKNILADDIRAELVNRYKSIFRKRKKTFPHKTTTYWPLTRTPTIFCVWQY